MEAPEDLFDREREWSDLADFVEQPGPGIRLALVRGRRRQGKSFLLRRLAAATGGFYYQALEQERAQALDAFGTSAGQHFAVPGGRLAFANWEEAIRAVTSPTGTNQAAVAIIDELPYLLTHSPELPSIIQREVDSSPDESRVARLIVCGSALSVMSSLLVGTQALRGRASHDLPIGTFDYRTAARFWQIDNPEAAFLVDSVIGGTPGYRALLPGEPPRRASDFAAWLRGGVLNPASAMFREDDYLLTEDRSLTDRALYHAVVGAIAKGNTRQSAIASAIGRENRAVQYPLKALEQAGFIVRQDDAFRGSRPIYRIADPIVRFHHVVNRPDLARFEERRFDDAWTEARQRFSAQVLGPHFENLAREFTIRFASPDTVGGKLTSVAPAVINDSSAKAQHQLDVVAQVRRSDGSTAVTAIGEAKYARRARTIGDLERLDSIRSLLQERERIPASTKLLLFAGSGFEQRLVDAADKRGDVELIDLDRIYSGN